ncbi:hypothetical protein [Jhaorihella thermophila]|nr:hypothetical protein [Jhaorihella thermophila]
MKPNFALSLSFDGITLLHRAGGGWRRVGSVALDAADLAGELADLRGRAEALDPAGVRCKLLIPNDQIRYMTIRTGRVSESERREAAAAALDGATPYALDELAFDVSADGEFTHIAAVARETLDEAESFANDHGFNPVSFVAVPEDESFAGEPFFGVTTLAPDLTDGAQVTPDEMAVVVIGEVEEPPAPEPQDAAIPGFASRRAKADRAAGEATDGMDPAGTADAPKIVPESAPEVERRLTIIQDDQPVSPADTPANAAESIIAEAKDGTSRQPVPQPIVPDSAVTAQRTTIPVAPPSPRIDDLPPDDESARLTVFGARQAPQAVGAWRHLGLVLSVALLLVLAAVAIWAMIFLEDGIAGLFRGRSDGDVVITAIEPPEAEEPDAASADTPPADTPSPEPQDATALPDSAPAPAAQIEAAEPATPAPTPPRPAPVDPVLPSIASLPAPTAAPRQPSSDKDARAEETLTETDAAVLEALRTPAGEAPDAEAPAGNDGAAPQDQALYAASGIWQTPPAVPEAPSIITLNDLYVASIDRTDLFSDAVVLPGAEALDTDAPLAVRASPAAAGTEFALDDRGLVEPTPEGTLTPEGILVHLGKPPVVPPPTPERPEVARQEQEAQERDARLAKIRPRARPGDLIEANERANLGGRSRAELGKLRPRLRPERDIPQAEPDAPATAQAVATAYRPKARPRNFSAAVERALASAQSGGAAATGPAVPASAAFKPNRPSAATVTRRATVKNAIRLRDVTLIGVYGTSANRRALVRLSSGRYKKVKVGDRIDGGQIIAIGDDELRYRKGSRNVVLKMPKG